MTPFEIMAQECDEVIMLINHFIAKAEHGDAPAPAKGTRRSDGQQLIKVNDKTATGGWW